MRPIINKILLVVSFIAMFCAPQLAMADNLTPNTSILFAVPNAGVVYKQGVNGFFGQFICTSGGTITIANTNYSANSMGILITAASPLGAISTAPAVKTVTPATGFTVLCASGDTSTYNYHLIGTSVP